MRVLITGADGFVGRHLIPRLEGAGHVVIPISGPTTVDGQEPLDVADEAAVGALVSRSAPEAIVHLAGFSSVASSHRDPVKSFRVNDLGPQNARGEHLLDFGQQEPHGACVQ